MDEELRRLQAALAERYRFRQEIGAGGMARVYLADDLKLKRPVAIKVLRPEVAALASDRFLREIELAANLHHPHILPLFDSGEADGRPFYVMPYIEGPTVRGLLHREKQLPVDLAVRLAVAVAHGLGHAHRQGIVHRDIKPENILLDGDRPLIADFGIARALSEVRTDRLTELGVVPGTPDYMSPEQAEGRDADGRADIYALACVLYEMLAGRPPFQGGTVQATLALHALQDPPSLEVVRPTVPSPVLAAIRKGLAKVPADRFQTADEFAAALTSPTPVAVPAVRTARRRWLPLVVAGLVIVAAAVALRWRGGAPPLDAHRVVVFPLAAPDTGAAVAAAGWNVALTLGAALEHTEPLRWIDGWTYLSDSLRAAPRRLTGTRAREVTVDRRARYYIEGVLQRGPSDAAVVLRLHDAAGDSLVAQETERGAADADYTTLALRSVGRLLPAILEPGRDVDLAPLADRAPAAIALSIQGDREYRRSRFGPALEFYRRAVEADSLLSFAAVKGAQAATWVNRAGEGAGLLGRALRHEALLPLKYRQFARGLDAYWAGRADEALSRYGAALAADSGWAEAWMALGDVFHHLLPEQQPADSLAFDAFTRAFAADSTFTPPLVHLTEIALRRGDVERAARWARRIQREESDTTVVRQLSLMVECVQSPDAADWAAAVATHPAAVMLAAKTLAGAAAQVTCAQKAFRAVLDRPELAAGYKWAALLGLQGLLLAQGRHDEVRALLDSAVAGGLRAGYSLYVFDALAGAPFDEGAAEAERLARAGAGEYYERADPENRWLLGVWQARRGALGRADTIARGLRADAERSGDRAVRLLADALDAHLTLARHDTGGAISRFERLRPVAPGSGLSWGEAAPLPIERMTLARLLLARGRPEAALREAAAFDHAGPIMFLPFLRESLDLRVRAAAQLGRRPQLAALERRVRALQVD